MNYINLTPHVLNIHHATGGVITVAPSGEVARVATLSEAQPSLGIDGVSIPVVKTTFGEVTGLPDPREGIVYIVSRLVLEAVKDARPDVFAPGELVRDADGRPIGCKGLSR